jgi:hypothetical protein
VINTRPLHVEINRCATVCVCSYGTAINGAPPQSTRLHAGTFGT